MNNPNWKSYTMAENYRTAKSILAYANSIIKNAKDIIKKDVVCMNTNKGDLSFSAKSQLDKFLSKLNPDDEWFLLTRSNKEMNMISTALKKMNIRHVCFKRSTSNNATLDSVKNKNGIAVMTIHASKGLEAENVAIYGKFKVDGKNMESDEVKVYYVALTRAKNKCVVFV
jgi:superfamily I DNA/RNA helicase